MMQESNLNTAMISPDPSGVAFGDPASTACVIAILAKHVSWLRIGVRRAIWNLF